MQTNYDDVTRWDDNRQCFLDRNGYPVSNRATIYKSATGMDGPINKLVLEPTSTGTRIRSSGQSTNVQIVSGTAADGSGGGLISNTGTTAVTWGDGGYITSMGTPLAMYGNEIRLNGMSDTQFVRYNATTASTEIAALSGGRLLTASGGSTLAANWDSNGIQARKYVRGSGAFSASAGALLSIAPSTRKPLPLGTMTSTGVSGSPWTINTIDTGNVLIAPFTGTVRVIARIWIYAPNTAANYCHIRVYNPSNDGVFVDQDEGVTLGSLSSGAQDIRTAIFSIVTVSAGERIALTATHEAAAAKNFVVLDYHVEYIA